MYWFSRIEQKINNALYHFTQIQPKLDEIIRLLHFILTKENIIMADLTALEAAVAANTTVEQSALTLLQGIAAALKAAQNDPVKIAALVTQLDANTQAWADAIVANTPAAEPTP